MLTWKKSLAYLPAGSENDWTTPFHIAASEGNVDMMNELSKHCPDCWEMLNSSGQNALHVAVLKNQEKLVNSLLLDHEEWHSLVDEPDNDGNTPLHLLAALNSNHVPLVLTRHHRAKAMSFNKQNQTPRDIALSSTNREFTGRLGRRDCAMKMVKEELITVGDDMALQKELQEKDARAKRHEEMVEKEKESIMKASKVHLVVATLLVTVTFAAGLTLPGGFDSDPGPTKGMATLLRKTAFHAFVVSDAIAFPCSTGAICSYFCMAAIAGSPYTHLKVVDRLFTVAFILQLVAMSAVVVAFVSGMYATLVHSLGLTIIVCAIGCLSFLLYLLIWYLMNSP